MGCTCADLRYSVSWAYIFGRAKLMDAALDGNLDEVKRLLDAGVKIDTEYEAGNTPLIYASVPGHLDVAMLLLERGADINKRTEYGYTVLHMAARFGRLDVVKMLVESGADLHAKIYDWETIPSERRGKTPLGWARMNMYKDHEYDNEHKEEIQPQVIAFLEAAMQAHGDSSSVSQQAGEGDPYEGDPYSVRASPTSLTNRARVAIFYDSPIVSASQALAMQDDEINYSMFLKANVKPSNLLVAGLGPFDLKERGVDTASKLRGLGFDALHLANPLFCNQALLAYGRDEVVAAFLTCADDAVALAGSDAVTMLKVSTTELLQASIGYPAHASAVLSQLPKAVSLEGVSAQLLLDAGLRLETLQACGYTLDTLVEKTDCSSAQLEKLGFSV